MFITSVCKIYLIHLVILDNSTYFINIKSESYFFFNSIYYTLFIRNRAF